jgi:hypothetical protein
MHAVTRSLPDILHMTRHLHGFQQAQANVTYCPATKTLITHIEVVVGVAEAAATVVLHLHVFLQNKCNS